jgi:hypothetical protein
MRFHHQIICIGAALASVFAGAFFTPSARANVYATDIKLNGNLAGITNGSGTNVAISYILNEPATRGVTVNILSGSSVVRSIPVASGAAGARKGTNLVTWDGFGNGGATLGGGTYTVNITASATGFTNWTQTSTDTNDGYHVFSPRGIAVNTNPNSVYYGRVFVGNATENDPAASPGDLAGILKANADGSPADEGQGNTNGLQAGIQWGTDGFNGNPHFLRYGQDDRIYALDWDDLGVVYAMDMTVSTNQVVLDANNYSANPITGFSLGWGEFDVTDAGTPNGRIFLGDNDSPGVGLWFWHLTNGVADPNDMTGTQVIAVGGDLDLFADGGSMMDERSNIFVGQNIETSGSSSPRVLEFTNWDGMSTFTNGSAWQSGANDDSFLGGFDLALDSRANPKFVAVALSISGGLRVLNATNGFIITNGTQVLDNLDSTNLYYGVAWDGAGNLYGAINNSAASDNKWRVFSPPGTNQTTTVAVETVFVPGAVISPITLTSIVLNGTTVTINFTDPSDDSPTSFSLQSSAAANSGFTTVGSAAITRTSVGHFQATVTSSATAQFYRIKRGS